MIALAFLIAALVIFLLAFFGVGTAAHMLALGLACVAAALIADRDRRIP